MASVSFIAIDLGAASGRIMISKLDNHRLTLQEIYRFPNKGISINNSLHWDILHLWDQITYGLALTFETCQQPIQSIGLDTWGVDFGLLDKNDVLIGNPYHYRDQRTDQIFATAFERLSKKQIYAKTGIQFIEFNSLFQLLSMVSADDPQLSIANTFLNLPDLFNFFLTGQKYNEFTISSTTQCINPNTNQWDLDLISTFGIPTQIFGKIIQPGTILGEIRPSLSQRLSLAQLPVVASAGHDTASAVAAVPASQSDYIYISSGTWSLMGIEIDKPLINDDSLEAGLSNEGGVENKIRFLKNISGLWFLQECRRIWNLQGATFSYDDLTELAKSAKSFQSLIAVNDKRFMAPADMPTEIQSFCKETSQPIPSDKAAIIRCILESLALEYRRVAEQIDQITGKYFPIIHIFGGGSKNRLLNQFAADATGRTVLSGPVEATVIGNSLVQAIAVGEIASLSEGRSVVHDSFDIVEYEPNQSNTWDEAYFRYLAICDSQS